ncbi:hypothetical protein D021_3923B, partial [Vibrio parahaemolyticus 10296]
REQQNPGDLGRQYRQF